MSSFSPQRCVSALVSGSHRAPPYCGETPAPERARAAAGSKAFAAYIGCSEMWCFRMWGLTIIALNPSEVPKPSVVEGQYTIMFKATSSNTTSLNSFLVLAAEARLYLALATAPGVWLPARPNNPARGRGANQVPRRDVLVPGGHKERTGRCHPKRLLQFIVGYIMLYHIITYYYTIS